MKKMFLTLAILGLMLLPSKSITWAEEAVNETKPKKEILIPEVVGNKICPVSGEKIDPKTKATYEYKGKIYNLCCEMCIVDFKKDPEKYVKIVEKEMQARAKENKEEREMMEEFKHAGQEDTPKGGMSESHHH